MTYRKTLSERLGIVKKKPWNPVQLTTGYARCNNQVCEDRMNCARQIPPKGGHVIWGTFPDRNCNNYIPKVRP